MSIPQHIVEAVTRYQDAYRHPELPRFSLSGLYALFPEDPSPVECEAVWPNSYPNQDRPGVYLVFDAQMSLMYVGKTESWLGARLGAHFYYSEGKGSGCAVRGTWPSRPAYLATIAVAESFEAPGLESFLIRELEPSTNVSGATRRIA